jgi:hypothetical protein
MKTYIARTIELSNGEIIEEIPISNWCESTLISTTELGGSLYEEIREFSAGEQFRMIRFYK